MRNRYVLAADMVAIVLCLVGAFVLRLDWFFQRQPEYTAAFNFALVASVLVKPIVYYAFGLYRRYWRYAGLPDLLVIFLAVSASAKLKASVYSGWRWKNQSRRSTKAPTRHSTMATMSAAST